MLSFLHPALLFGALLFAVPLLIHLLNRQRYRRREWAAMDFLLRAYKKQRRRLRMENLLLLLLRCLIPIAIAFAIARPQLRDAAGISALAGAAHHVIVLDRTYSMGLQPAGQGSPFERMRTLAGQLLERLETRPANTVTIVSAGVRITMPIREESNFARAKATLAAFAGPEDGGDELLPALQQVADLVEQAEGEQRVYLFSDLQARAFGDDRPAAAAPVTPADPTTATTPPGPAVPPTTGETPDTGEPKDPFRDTLRDVVLRLQERGKLLVVDCGTLEGQAENVQLLDLQLGRPQATARVPVPVHATVRNLAPFGRDVQVTLEIDGAEPTRKSIRLDAGAEGRVEFPVVLREVGLRRLRASIDGDALAADNERFLVVPVRDRVRVLIVEGGTETDPVLQESGWVRAVLDVTEGEGAPDVTPFATRVVDVVTFLSGRESPARYDLVLLANVERLNEAAARSLREAVQAGTGLLVMLGSNVDPDSWNLLLGGIDGDGLLPMRIGAPTGFRPGGEESYGSTLRRPDHPAFAELDREVFRMTPVYRFVPTIRGTVRESAEVLASLRDPDESPLLVASTLDAGRVLTLTSTVNRRPDKWNGFDWYGIAIPFFWEMTYWLTTPVDTANVETGATLVASVANRPSNVAVVLPERAGATKTPVADDAKPLPGRRFAIPPFRRTEYAGFYGVEMQLDVEGALREDRLWFAVNPPAAEGMLRYLAHEQVRDRFGVTEVVRVLPSEGSALESGLTDLGIPLLYLALAFLIVEAALARFVSRRR